MIPGRPSIAELDQLQRKTHAARRALKSVQSEARAALQLVAQVDDSLAALRRQLEPTQPEEAQHDHEEETQPAVHA